MHQSFRLSSFTEHGVTFASQQTLCTFHISGKSSSSLFYNSLRAISIFGDIRFVSNEITFICYQVKAELFFTAIDSQTFGSICNLWQYYADSLIPFLFLEWIYFSPLLAKRLSFHLLCLLYQHLPSLPRERSSWYPCLYAIVSQCFSRNWIIFAVSLTVVQFINLDRPLDVPYAMQPDCTGQLNSSAVHHL